MILIDKNFIKQTKYKYIKKIKPKYFLPYAGFFREKLKRDEMYIKYNKKNETKDYVDICKKYNVKLLDPEKFNIFKFKDNESCKSSKYKGKYFKDLNSGQYLRYFMKKYQKVDLNYIKDYFLNSKFHDNSKLYISLTNDNFETEDINFKITFAKKIKFLYLNQNFKDTLKNDNNFLYLKIRKEAFLNTIYNKRSWEDISIEFQNRQFRKPNKYNKKNETKDYLNICKKYNVKLLDPERFNIFEFKDNKSCKSTKYKGKYFKDLNADQYLKYFIKKYQKVDFDYIENYFLNSGFHDNSKLYISLTNDNFETEDINFKITFTKKIEFSYLDKNLKDTLEKDNNFLYLKIRKEAFLNTIYNKRSWEDISIGFQNRQFRKPNKYNSNFWYHFSNIYVSNKFIKSTTDCSNCISLNQDIHNMIFKKIQNRKNYI